MDPQSGEKRVQISLKALPTAVQRAMPANLPSIVQTEYASRYCESIGVTADKESVEYFLSCMPVKDALVAPNWTTSTLEIIPGRGNETAAQTQMRAARDKEAILRTGKKKPDSPNGRTVEKYNFGSGARSGTRDPTSGATGGKKKAVGVRKQIPRNTLSFRLLIKTLCEVGVNDLEVKSFREMLKPVTCDTEDIGCALRSFFECMPAFVPQFKDEGEIPTIHLKVIKFLRDPLCESFFSLLLRYGYWNVVHPIVRAVLKDGKLAHPEMFNSTGEYIHTHTPAVMLRQVLYRDADDADDEDASSTTSGTSASLSMATSLGHSSDAGFHLTNMSLASETSLMAEEKETLFVKLENCMNKLSKKMDFNYADMSIGQRAFVACCHFVCDEILKHKYKWFVMESANHKGNKKQEVSAQRTEFITRQNLDYCRLQLQRAVHECLSDILDPIRIYGTNLVRKEIVENMLPSGMTTKIRGQYHMTSAPVRALMGTAGSAEARRFLSRCTSSSYVPLPGSRPPDAKKTHIERGTSFDELLLPPELTWNGTKGSKKPDRGGRSTTSSQKPFSSTIVKAEHTELPLSTTGKNSLFSIIKEKQKNKYSGHRLDKFSRCPDVKSRTVLLDDMGDPTCPAVSPISSRYSKRPASSSQGEEG